MCRCVLLAFDSEAQTNEVLQRACCDSVQAFVLLKPLTFQTLPLLFVSPNNTTQHTGRPAAPHRRAPGSTHTAVVPAAAEPGTRGASEGMQHIACVIFC